MKKYKINLYSRLIILVCVFLHISMGNLFADQSYWERILKRIEGGKSRAMETSPEDFSDITSKSVEKIEDWERSKNGALVGEETLLPVKGAKGGGKTNESTIAEKGEGIPPGAQILKNVPLSDGSIAVIYKVPGNNLALAIQIYKDEIPLLGENHILFEYSRDNSWLNSLGYFDDYPTVEWNISLFSRWTKQQEEGYIPISWIVTGTDQTDGVNLLTCDGGIIIVYPHELVASYSVSPSIEYTPTTPLSNQLFRNLSPTLTSTAGSTTTALSGIGGISSTFVEETADLAPGFEDTHIPENYEGLEEYLKEEFEGYGFINLIAALMPEEALEDLLSYLNSKEDKTEIEESVLELSSAILADMQNISDETMKEFREAVHLVLVAGAMEDILEGVDFGALKTTISDFADMQKVLLESHLSQTEEIYSQIAKLLGVSVTDELLPDRYLKIQNLDMRAKKKILVDIELENLKEKDEKDLTAAEKSALGIWRGELEELNNNYIKALKRNVTKFVSAIKQTLQGAPHVSVRRKKEDAEALFLLDKTIKK